MRAVSLKGKPSRSVVSVRRSYVRTAWPEQHKTLRVFAGHKVQRSEEGRGPGIPLKEVPPPNVPRA